MNTNDKGDISVAIIMAKLVQRGYTVLLPFGNNKRYDLALDIDGKLVRVQCKTASSYRGGLIISNKSVRLRGNHRYETKPYTNDEIDTYMAYSPQTDKVYILPVVNKTEIKLRIDPLLVKNNRTRPAKDYEFNGEMPEWIKGTSR